MPQLAVINESKASSDVEVQNMMAAFEQQWNIDVKPIWGIEAASFAFVPKGLAPPEGTWWVVFLDNRDQADALAYHDFTAEGLPLSKIFVKPVLADNTSLSVRATHEVVEMAVDPGMNTAYQDPSGAFWAGDVADPVGDDRYGYEISGVLVTDFVTPSWFSHRAQARVDFKGHGKKAFKVLPGGNAQRFDSKHGWQPVADSKTARFACDNRCRLRANQSSGRGLEWSYPRFIKRRE